MPESFKKRRSAPLEILIHIFMAPASRGTFSWQLPPEMMDRLAEDLRWTILRKIYPAFEGRSPYAALIQKHAIRVDSLDIPFFREILEVIREKYVKSFSIRDARNMSELDILNTYFIPVILEWAENERSTSVARERTPSIEDLITHEDSSGNCYQRFPDEFTWVLQQNSPGIEPAPPRKIPDEMRDFVHRIASELTGSLRKILESGKLEKYVILMARLEDNICTWEMTFDYLSALGVKRYSSWKSLSVVANRALRQYVGSLSPDVKTALHQDDPKLSKEEKHARLRLAVTAALELDPLPSPRELVDCA